MGVGGNDSDEAKTHSKRAKELVQTKNHTESPLPGDVDAVPRASTQHAGVEGCTANTQWTMVNSGEQGT